MSRIVLFLLIFSMCCLLAHAATTVRPTSKLTTPKITTPKIDTHKKGIKDSGNVGDLKSKVARRGDDELEDPDKLNPEGQSKNGNNTGGVGPLIKLGENTKQSEKSGSNPGGLRPSKNGENTKQSEKVASRFAPGSKSLTNLPTGGNVNSTGNGAKSDQANGDSKLSSSNTSGGRKIITVAERFQGGTLPQPPKS